MLYHLTGQTMSELALIGPVPTLSKDVPLNPGTFIRVHGRNGNVLCQVKSVDSHPAIGLLVSLVKFGDVNLKLATADGQAAPFGYNDDNSAAQPSEDDNSTAKPDDEPDEVEVEVDLEAGEYELWIEPISEAYYGISSIILHESVTVGSIVRARDGDYKDQLFEVTALAFDGNRLWASIDYADDKKPDDAAKPQCHSDLKGQVEQLQKQVEALQKNSIAPYDASSIGKLIDTVQHLDNLLAKPGYTKKPEPANHPDPAGAFPWYYR
jgi:hypothetical protein